MHVHVDGTPHCPALRQPLLAAWFILDFYELIGQHDKALQVADAGLADLFKMAFERHQLLASLCVRAGLLDRAAKEYEALVDCSPDAWDGYVGWMDVLQQRHGGDDGSAPMPDDVVDACAEKLSALQQQHELL